MTELIIDAARARSDRLRGAGAAIAAGARDTARALLALCDSFARARAAAVLAERYRYARDPVERDRIYARLRAFMLEQDPPRSPG